MGCISFGKFLWFLNARKDELTGSILLPLFSSVSDSIEAIILTMHKEDFSMTEYHGKKSSPYIREMEGFIKRVVRDHFR